LSNIETDFNYNNNDDVALIELDKRVARRNKRGGGCCDIDYDD